MNRPRRHRVVRSTARRGTTGRTPVVVALMLASPLVPAADFVVITTADSVDATPGDGVCADAGGACSLRAAVQEANALPGADRIELPAGRYVLSLAGPREDLAASGDLDVHDALTIVGAGAGTGADATVIDGKAADTVLELHPDAATVRFEGLTVANGYFESNCPDWSCGGAGGLMVREGVALTLRHVDFRDNRSHRFNTMSAVLNLGCIDGDYVRVIGNLPARDGGSEPLAPFGGSLEFVQPQPCITLDHSEFSGNRGDFAGAMELRWTRLVMRRSLVHGNAGRFAGAFNFNILNDVLLENVTIAGNRGGSYGVLIHDGSSEALLRHVTITDNEGGSIGGISEANDRPLILSNTIITGNRFIDPHPWDPAPDCAGEFTSAGGTLIGSRVREGFDAPHDPATTCTIEPMPGDQFDTPLALGELADHGGFTRTILPVDSAIDTGIAEECTATDQRDLPRPAGAGCDLGAVELDADDTLFADGFDSAGQAP